MIKTSKFSKNLKKVLLGNLVCQGLPFLFIPVLSRLYSPHDFGVLGMYMAVVLVVVAVSALKYDQAFFVNKWSELEGTIIFTCIIISVIVSMLFFVISTMLLPFIHVLTIDYVFVISLTILIVSNYQIFLSYYNRHCNYSLISVIRSLQGFLFVFISVLVGLFFNRHSLGLCYSYLAAQTTCAFILLAWFVKKNGNIFRRLKLKRIRYLLIRYKNFPKYNMPATLLEIASQQVSLVAIGFFFGTQYLGYITMSQRIIGSPVNFIGQAVSRVFRQEAADQYAEFGSCEYLFLNVCKKLLLVAIAPFATLLLFHNMLIKTFLGPEWFGLSSVLFIFVPMYFMQFIVSPLSVVFFIAEKQKLDLFIQVLLVSFANASVLAGYYLFHSFYVSLILFVIVYCMKYILEGLLSYKIAQGKEFSWNLGSLK